MDIYSFSSIIPLSFTRVRAGVLVTGLTVTVTVKNAATGASLLASTSVPEALAGSGIYTYNWTHGLSQDTECLVTFSVGGSPYSEYILISNNSQPGGRTA